MILIQEVDYFIHAGIFGCSFTATTFRCTNTDFYVLLDFGLGRCWSVKGGFILFGALMEIFM